MKEDNEPRTTDASAVQPRQVPLEHKLIWVAFYLRSAMLAQHPGHDLGNYHLLKQIVFGAFTNIYLGEHRYLKSQAAIKVLENRSLTEDFLAQARLTARLNHPNIGRILESGVDEGVPYFVREYSPFGALSELYPRGIPLPLKTVVSYVKQIADALQYIHDHGIVPLVPYCGKKQRDILRKRNGKNSFTEWF